MGDPITAGVVASSLMPTAGAAAASSIPALAGAGALAAPFAAAPALGVMPQFAPLMMSGNPLVSAMGGGIASNAGGGLFSGMSMPSTITGLGKDISALNTFMNQNPITSRLGMEAAGSLMQGPAPIQMPGGMPVSRGQIQPADFMSLLNPQQSQVIRPQSISLLG